MAEIPLKLLDAHRGPITVEISSFVSTHIAKSLARLDDDRRARAFELAPEKCTYLLSYLLTPQD